MELERDLKMKKNQRGVFLVFTAIVLVGILAMLALAIDVGRLLITTRNMQIAADAAALAGVERLRKCDITKPWSSPRSFDCSGYGGGIDEGNGGWRAVKPAISAVLNGMKLDGARPQIVYGSIPTRCDITDTIDGFGNLQFEQGLSGSDLNVRVERLFECANGSAIELHSLEISAYTPPVGGYHYCLANAVRVTLNYTGHVNMLSSILGAESATNLTRTAIARVRRTTGTLAEVCNMPDCSLMNSMSALCSPSC